MISNELLTELLGFEVSHSQPKGEKEISIFKNGRTNASQYLSICDIERKCKEFVIQNGYQFKITQLAHKVYFEFGKQGNGFPIDITHYGMDASDDYFAMAQWVLNDKNKEQK